MAESKEELKSLLMTVKEESEIAGIFLMLPFLRYSYNMKLILLKCTIQFKVFLVCVGVQSLLQSILESFHYCSSSYQPLTFPPAPTH